ncbi:hypothetical protein Tco_0728182 [Tanacetum coccineum]|uniref:Uncharacterized protein n=1 Tax=Tanacetum coccineum TaxID=301880 RepID=A0ABQ4YMR4_9ASTR
MLRRLPHHGFTELTQIDTFYNGLNDNDQDSLNAGGGWKSFEKVLVRRMRVIDKLADQLSTLVEIVSKKVVTPAPVKAVEETCVTCGGAHSCTAQIPPPVIPISIPEPDVPNTLPKTTPIPESDIPKSLPKANIPKIAEFDMILDTSIARRCLLKKASRKLGDTDKFLIPCVACGMVVSFIFKDENEQIIFHVNGTTKHPQKHVNESIKMVNDTCKDSFKKFTDEPALVCLPPSEDDNDEKEKQEVKNLAESTAKRQTRITPCLKNFKVICKESIFHSNKTPQVSSVFAITSTLPSIEPKDSLIMRDDHLSTFSAEEIIPIPRGIRGYIQMYSRTFLPSCDEFSSSTFHVMLLLPKISYDSNLDESTFLVTPLSNSNKDECLAPGDDIEFLLHHDSILYDAPIDKAECFDPRGDNDEIDAFLAIEVPTYIEEGYYDSEGDGRDSIIFSGPDDSIPPGIESDFDSEEDIIDNLLNDDPIPEYEHLTFDMEPDVPVINNVYELNEDECFDPGGGEINVEVDDSFTFVTRTFLPYLTYLEVSPLLSSTENEDTIFDPGIVAFQFSSQEPVFKGGTSSPLVSPSTIINVCPTNGISIDVAATFGVPLTTVGDLQKLINDIDAGKHDELLSELTNEDRFVLCDDSINLNRCWTHNYLDQPNVNSNFRTLVADPVFDGVNISIPRKVVEKAKHGMKRIMMNSKGFFFFKFDSRAGLEAFMEELSLS